MDENKNLGEEEEKIKIKSEDIEPKKEIAEQPIVIEPIVETIKTEKVKDNNGNKTINKEPKYRVSYGKVNSNSASSARSIIGGMLGGILGALIIVVIAYGLVKSGTIKLGTSSNTTNTETNSESKIVKVENVSDAPIAVAEKLGSSIVGIVVTSTQENIFGMLQEGTGEGSGIIYSSDGYIVTNYHVIEDAYNNKSATIKVILPDTDEGIDAVIVGADKTSDLAVIKIDKTGLPAAEFGDSSELKVGEMVVAIGNPLGIELKGSVTVGYVSALNREVTTDGKKYKLIQTDAAINPGNSGGALANTKGQVIGISNIKMGGSDVEGLGFAILMNDAKPIIEELIENKKIARPYIGIYGRDLDSATAKKNNLVEGIYVSSIIEFSPAEKAGIKAGDVIVKVEGKSVKTMDELNVIKNAKKIGDKIEVVVNRAGKEVKLTVELTESQD